MHSQASSSSSSSTLKPSTADKDTIRDEQLATAEEDTIVSVVTGPTSQGAVAIIRISGSDAIDVSSRLFRPNGRHKPGWRPITHQLYYGTVVDDEGAMIDEVLLLPMLSPRSYTREDVIELHCHGGGVCAERVLRRCLESGARPARPGEFTLRAFLNGRLDLAQAESVLQLVTARTPAAADSALAGLQGGLGQAVGSMRHACLALLAELEARLDFDEDLPAADNGRLRQQVESLQQQIEAALRTARRGQLLRTGLQVAIVGRPNVGKSSLLNAWTRTDRAIVTDIAGTTRDVLEAGLVLPGGVPLTLLDTAGIRRSSDAVEKIGVERSQAAAVGADIVLMVMDASAGWTAADAEIFRSMWGDGPGSSSCLVQAPALLVANKMDLMGDGSRDVLLPIVPKQAFSAVVKTCATSRAGLEELEQGVLTLAGAPELAAGGLSWAVNERQAAALVAAHEALMRVAESVGEGLPIDFWTIDLRAAVIALGEVSGDDLTEEVLDAVFSKFCIGK